jgi:hypothetical protein
MISALAIRFKVRGFKHGQGDGILWTIKIRSTPSFGEEVKPSATCSKILQHIKITCKNEQKYFARPNSSFFSPVPPACYQMTLLVGFPEYSGGRIRSLPTSFHDGFQF